MLFLGIDVGTTGTKALIADASGRVFAQSYREYPMEQPAPGCYELNPNRVWDAVVEVIRHAVASLPPQSPAIAALSVSSLGESVVFLDAKGRVLGNSLLYLDHRGTEAVEALIATHGEAELAGLTGHNPHPMYTLPKLLWHREHNREAYDQVATLLPFGSLVLFRLGAAPVIDYSLASRTLAMDIWSLQWSEPLIRASGLDPSVFPELAPAGTVVGTVDPQMAAALGLNAGTRLVLGAHDQICAAIGSGSGRSGSAAYGMGTVHCLTPAFSRNIDPVRMRQYHFPIVPSSRDQFMTYAFCFGGGGILKWFRDELGGVVAATSGSPAQDFYQIMDSQVADVPSDLILIPHFCGSGTPTMNPNLKGALFGLDFGTRKADIYRAMMEGVAYEMRTNLDCLTAAGIEIETLNACGGGAKSRCWLQITADVLNRDVAASGVQEAGVWGTIVLSAVAMGVWDRVETASAQLLKEPAVFRPRPDFVARYADSYPRYQSLLRACEAMPALHSNCNPSS